jgi:hypothetical protein
LNNRATLALARSLLPGHRLVVLDYDRFWGSPESLARLLASVGLDPGRMLGSSLGERYAEARALVNRPTPLPAGVTAHIDRFHDAERDAAVRAIAMA